MNRNPHDKLDVSMASGQTSGLKRFILWDYPRASWQYDVMVALILAFVFLTPRNLFQDQPRAGDIVRLPAERGAHSFWVEPNVLESIPESQRPAYMEQILRSRFGKRESVVSVDPVFAQERELKGYMVASKP
ncbi:MAG TPA: hypothetical protein VEQ63_11670 [Bryobacteraceae bacterium]|nr:hypothetical protein [Bryobacteraceae bacterium]